MLLLSKQIEKQLRSKAVELIGQPTPINSSNLFPVLESLDLRKAVAMQTASFNVIVLDSKLYLSIVTDYIVVHKQTVADEVIRFRDREISDS